MPRNQPNYLRCMPRFRRKPAESYEDGRKRWRKRLNEYRDQYVTWAIGTRRPLSRTPRDKIKQEHHFRAFYGVELRYVFNGPHTHPDDVVHCKV